MTRIAVGGFLHETNCAAPGAMPADSAALPWTRLHPGLRIKPNGPAFAPAVKSRSPSPAIG